MSLRRPDARPNWREGHRWLEELMQDAEHPAAADDLKADALAVLKWLGVEKAEHIKTLHQDKFARGFETYMMEGRAPSRQLAPIFVKQKEWFTEIYRKQLLNTPLNDDIRGVFDRLLATREEIAEWQAERNRAAAAPERSSDREADRLFKLAADQGHAWAQAALGNFPEHGRGSLTKDDREAARLYKLAADQGDANALASLGLFYQQGRGGLPKDDGEAARLFRLAADQRDAFAQVNLGLFLGISASGLRVDGSKPFPAVSHDIWRVPLASGECLRR
jgi:hypothetical protein